MRTPVLYLNPDDVPDKTFNEIIKLGIWPSTTKAEIGTYLYKFTTKVIIFIGHTTREEYINQFEKLFNHRPDPPEGIFFNLIEVIDFLTTNSESD